MKKSTVLKGLGTIVLAALLAAAIVAIIAAQSYETCVSRLIESAPPTDAQPPETFLRLSRTFWGHRDLGLARILQHECTSGAHGVLRRLGGRTFALGVVKGLLGWPERVALSSIFLPAHGGQGLTHSAHMEWGRPPESLNEREMVWLFVVGQEPGCSKQRRPGSEVDRKACTEIYQGRLDQLSRSLPRGADGEAGK